MTPGVILEEKNISARICIQIRLFYLILVCFFLAKPALTFIVTLPICATKKHAPNTGNIRGTKNLFRGQGTAHNLVWSSGREQEHKCNPGWGGGVKDPGKRCKGTMGPTHKKWVNTQSFRSENGSGMAESREWREGTCGRGAKRADSLTCFLAFL